MEKLLEKLIEKSLKELYLNDKYLIDNRCSERSIAFRFAHYFINNMQETTISKYDADCEYNRDADDIKRIYDSCIYPDFILHKRGTNDNLLMIEFKTWWNDNTEYDCHKLQNMMKPPYNYQYAYSIVLNKDNPKITPMTKEINSKI